MKIYSVGGSVRDEILGIEAFDRDFVVVGATEAEFLEKFPKAEKVGKSFPVFLVNGCEYAFARRERKNGYGYRGFAVEFSPDITLEEDLKRRDITINAIAKDPDFPDKFIDPYGGIEDIKNKRIIHVSEAFSEDPLRVYRVARFAAKFPDFSVDKSTVKLMKSIGNELMSLSAERVWKELEKTLVYSRPSRFFEVLKEADLLKYHFPEVANLVGVPAGPIQYHPEGDSFIHTVETMDRLRLSGSSDPVAMFAALCHDWGKAASTPDNYPHHYGHDKAGVPIIENFCRRMKNVPERYEFAAKTVAKYHMIVREIDRITPKKAIVIMQNILKCSCGLDGFMDAVKADNARQNDEARAFIKKMLPVLDVRLPEKYWNEGPKSAEILMQLKILKYKELSGTNFAENN
ncbi:multifunctional CCA tRNA nucleotidyl transferase/2'3'-cyclic phosphodiesterase/2'nucleotidase/phosphatase [bacterium]|nr:multifunctional CCA tRNA nucleotidyl transferase/2'3'-cyclic phosphodiesterase/2'nucleotidase/phosphatase [bacterium]